jgi:hypothetical protein
MRRKFVTKQKINANCVLLLCDTLIATTRSKVITAAGDFPQMLPFEMQIDPLFAPSLGRGARFDARRVRFLSASAAVQRGDNYARAARPAR